MSDRPLFTNQEAQEAAYAPQESADPEQRRRAMAEEGTLGENRAGGTDTGVTTEPPAAAPVAQVGTQHTGFAAPPAVVDERDDTLRADALPFGADPDDDATTRSGSGGSR